MRPVCSLIVLILVSFYSTPIASGESQSAWSSPFISAWPDGPIRVAVNYDRDGIGPDPEVVVMAGAFSSAGGVSAGRVAVWDGAWWSSLGTGFPLEIVHDMVVLDEDGAGPLPPMVWIAGASLVSPGVLGSGLAVWDGESWLDPGCPANGVVRVLVVDEGSAGGPILYAAVNSQISATVWKYQAGVWAQVGDSLDSPTDFGATPYATVQCLCLFDEDGDGPLAPALFVGGELWRQSPGPLLNCIARWNGVWEPVGVGFNPVYSMHAMQVFDPDGSGPAAAMLVIGGASSNPGSTGACLGRWNGQDWASLGDMTATANPRVTDITTFDVDANGPLPPRLWAAGNFTSVAGVSASGGLASWDGVQWRSESHGTNDGYVDTVRWPCAGRSDPVLLTYSASGGSGAGIFDGTNWVSPDGFYSPTQLWPMWYPPASSQPAPLLGLIWRPIGGGSNREVVRLEDRRWQPLAWNSLPGIIDAVASYDLDGPGPLPPTVIACGAVNSPSLQPYSALLVNDTWTFIVSPGPFARDGVPPVMAVLDVDGPGPLGPLIFVGGRFPDDTSTYRYGVAQWDEDHWTVVPGRFNSMPSCLVMHDEDDAGPRPPCLFVGGIDKVDGVAMNGVARWDGAAWSPLVDVVSGTVGLGGPIQPPQYAPFLSLVSHDPDGSGPMRPVLVVIGSFHQIDGTQFNHTGYWDGGQWHPLGAGLYWAYQASAVSYDPDGDGPLAPRLFVSGVYPYSGSLTYPGVMYWDGSQWQALTPNQSGGTRLLVHDADGSGPTPPLLYAMNVKVPELGSAVVPFARYGSDVPIILAASWSQSAAIGQQVVLRVAVGGQAPFAYQWRRDGQPLVDGGAISGAMTEELVIQSFADNDAGQYDCVVTNVCGRATSPPADVRVCLNAPTGDQNGDGAVNGRDIQPFVARILSAANDAAAICAVDFSGNHTVDAADITAMVALLLGN